MSFSVFPARETRREKLRFRAAFWLRFFRGKNMKICHFDLYNFLAL